MPELERNLRRLGPELDWPATPELASAVRRRLPDRPARRWGRLLVPVVAALVLALVAAALLVPSARTSILRFFHLRGVTVERVDRLPAARPLAPHSLGVRVSLPAAARQLGRPVLLPGGRRPDAAYIGSAFGGITLRYGPLARPRLLVSEFLTTEAEVLKKYADAASDVTPVLVDGRRGLWIGGEHAAQLGPLPPRLAASALLWESGDLTIRLEADVSKEEALELARTFRR